MKEQVTDISFSCEPDVRIRIISSEDNKTVQKNKKKFPFELHNSVYIKILTDKREFGFTIFNGFTWNGADIPRFFWRLIGSRTDNDWLIASMIHDYMLEFKVYMMNEVLGKTMTVREYRRLTSIIFRHIIKQQGTNIIKANVMSWSVDVFQMFNRRSWQCQ